MAEIKGHAEGWQKVKKGYSDEIRKEGNNTLKETRLTEQQAQVAKALQSAKTGQVSAPEIQKPQPKVNEAPQAKPETKISKEESQKNAQNSAAAAAKASAAGLKKLEGRINTDVTRSADPVVDNTRDAKILSEPRTAKTDVTKTVATPDARVAAENVTRNLPTTRKSSEETKNKKDKSEQNDLTKKTADTKDQGAKKADANPVLGAQAAQASSQVSKSEPRGEVEKKKEPKEKEIRTDKTESSSAYAAKSGAEPNAQKELGNLLGGNTGGNSESGEGEKNLAEVSKVAKPVINEIPQTYPGLTVYNEQTAGTEVRGRAQIYKTFVEKLADIAKVDEEIGHKIESLKDRLIGEMKDEIKASDFLKSIYGGLIG